SSPRMWGTLVRDAGRCDVARFIPTHVGNTRTKRLRHKPDPVHPHACGEHLFADQNEESHTGSSPRMWGTREFPVKRVKHERFIPTHVGNTGGYRAIDGQQSVHPHACGEHG